MDAVAVAGATTPIPSVKVLTWGIGTLAILVIAVQLGLGPKPLVTAQNPRSPDFAFGPIPGSVTQSISYPGGPLESLSVWASTMDSRPQQAVAHIVRSSDGQIIRTTLFHVSPGDDLQPTTIGFDPIDLPAGAIHIRIVVPEETQARVYVGATLNDAYAGGRLIDGSGNATLGVDLAFATTGEAGALRRLQAQARQAPLFLIVGLAVALLLGTAVGSAARSSLQHHRFGRLAAVSVTCGVTAAVTIALLHGPDALT